MGILDRKIEKETPEPKDLTIDEQIVGAMKQVYDPEIPVNIYDMGLIYKFDHNEEDQKVTIDMTLTSPNCPAAQTLPVDVKNQVETLPDVAEAEVNIVWEPPWGPENMSDEAKLELGFL